ncbi:MAG: UDP-N-acetylmuramate dehydrogenase [Clostridiales bacterium]|jgi:UDP-N-acetylmuramate dehydrogenase|nr:UDP-N-acetylmuramate dehydrogenase [Clostridiales bacterium]
MTTIESLCAHVIFNEPMSKHTHFNIGGPADVMAFPETTDELINVWNFCKTQNMPITVLGDGKNVLVADEGICGVVVFTNKMNAIEILGEHIRAQSGTRLSTLADTVCNANLAGLAFASGIPGTVGGAIYMNAGAYKYEIKDFCVSVTLFSNNEIIVKTNAEMNFGYRQSLAQSAEMLILDATFKLYPGDSAQIREQMNDLNARRRKTQPLEFGSAGSFFKRPAGDFAGKLIEDSGLKGFRINDAQVSDKHAGFVVNRGNASAKDVIALMHHVQETVFVKYGVKLEPEVRILGF